MKIQKNLLLTLALTAACLTQSTYGMSPAKSLQSVSRVLDTVNTYWKPVAGSVVVIGAGYWLWSCYNKKPSHLTDHDLTNNDKH